MADFDSLDNWIKANWTSKADKRTGVGNPNDNNLPGFGVFDIYQDISTGEVYIWSNQPNNELGDPNFVGFVGSGTDIQNKLPMSTGQFFLMAYDLPVNGIVIPGGAKVTALVPLNDLSDVTTDNIQIMFTERMWVKYIEEAPLDGLHYVRKDHEWVDNNVLEDPKDGIQYVRLNGEWVENDVLEAPEDGQQYVRKDGSWYTIVVDVTEAPLDGQQYVRKDGDWTVISADVEEAPIDNQQYVRINGGWQQVDVSGLLDEAPLDGKWYVRQSGTWVPSEQVITVAGDGGLTIMGSLPSVDALPPAGNFNGESWIINGVMLVWDGLNWVPVGNQGPQGIPGPMGPQGAIGLTGPQGEVGPQGPPGEQGPQGIQGPVGPQGPKGEAGSSVTILGSLNNSSELPLTGNLGDGYIIGLDLWIWNDTEWLNVGPVKGPQGEQGPIGETGPQGPAGPQGIQGIPGPIGIQGPKGDTGDRGIPGEDGLPGQNIQIVGSLASTAELPLSANTNDSYLIDGDLWVWDGTTWINVGQIQGPPGPAGASVYIKGSLLDPSLLPTTNNTISDGYIIGVDLWVWTGTEWENVGQIRGPQGEQGLMGPQGPPGPIGPKGDQGDQGIPGQDGKSINIVGSVSTSNDLPATGTLGEGYIVGIDLWLWSGSTWINVGPIRGPKGPQGIPGQRGYTGSNGPRGYTGATGATGPIGYTGMQGPIGPQGPQGIEGPIGPQGPQGVAGGSVTILGSFTNSTQLPVTGNLGDGYLIEDDLWIWNGNNWQNIGPVRGPVGPQGIQGPVGPQGAQGIQGIQGPEGPQGVPGVPGIQGIQGEEGPVGPAGENGIDGAGVTILGKFSDPSELPVIGSLGDSYIIGDDLWIWNSNEWQNMGQIRGPQGPMGPAGPRGTQGPQGLTGPRGYSGPRGYTGLQGPVGPQGPAGPQGLKGDTGPQGPGITILGKLNDQSELPTSGNLGEGYLIGTEFWGWTGTQYENLGNIQGPKGEDGNRWISLPRNPSPIDGEPDDYFLNSVSNEYFFKTNETFWASMGHLGGGNVYDAPADSQLYVRVNQGWTILPTYISEAPEDGQQYVRRDGGWAVSIADVEEAPLDGQQYVRQSGNWSIISADVEEAPIDGNSYARQNGTWVIAQTELDYANAADITTGTDETSVVAPSELKNFMINELGLTYDPVLGWINDEGTI